MLSKSPATVTIKKFQKKFPRIPRFITELPQKKWFFYTKIDCFSLITTILLVTIILRGYELFEGIQVLEAATTKHEDIAKERAYWIDVATRHPGYRDAEFKLAILSYQLGEKDKAKEYLDETLTIDPNFKEGREFAKQVGL